MSPPSGFSRRALLGLFRKKEEPAAPTAEAPLAPEPSPPAPAFSLEGFYAARNRTGEATTDGRIPVFSLREGLVVPQQAPKLREAAPQTPPPPHSEARRSAEPSSGSQGPRQSVPVLGAVVSVRPQLCLAWQGSFCSTCVERCPVEGAIALDAGRPRVVAERCNGCGLCVRVCPAPLNAFELHPAGSPGGSP